MSGNYVLVTVKDGKPISSGRKSSDIKTLKEWQKDANKKCEKDGINHIIVPVGQKGQSTVVTVSRKNPKYSSVGTPISSRVARDVSEKYDFKHGKYGLNYFTVNSDGKYTDLYVII